MDLLGRWSGRTLEVASSVQAYLVEFAAEVTDEQRLLSGARLVALEGEGVTSGEVWTLVLSFVQPKEAEAPFEEGDLTLSGPAGELFAGLIQGWSKPEFDERSGAEQETLSLRLGIEGGEGAFAGARGTVRLLGALSGGRAELRAEVDLEAGAEEADHDGCA